MSTFVTLLIIGLSEGAILALAALGFVLIYKATGVINFAQGEFLLIGAYSFYTAFVVMQLPIAWRCWWACWSRSSWASSSSASSSGPWWGRATSRSSW